MLVLFFAFPLLRLPRKCRIALTDLHIELWMAYDITFMDGVAWLTAEAEVRDLAVQEEKKERCH
eukprot:4652738-Prorocentrum_lima.AAC.1